MGDVLVGATIIFLGLINPDSDYFDNTDAATTQGGGTKVCQGRGPSRQVVLPCHMP